MTALGARATGATPSRPGATPAARRHAERPGATPAALAPRGRHSAKEDATQEGPPHFQKMDLILT